jgi:hypothetical protein
MEKSPFLKIESYGTGPKMQVHISFPTTTCVAPLVEELHYFKVEQVFSQIGYCKQVHLGYKSLPAVGGTLLPTQGDFVKLNLIRTPHFFPSSLVLTHKLVLLFLACYIGDFSINLMTLTAS